MAEFTRGVANADDILTSTLDKYRGKLTEQWLNSFAVTKKMMEAGNVKFEDGGNTIVEDLEYQDNDTAAWVNDSDTVSTTINQILTQAKYSWKMLAGTVGIYDSEEAKNAGESRMHDLLKTRIENLKNTMTSKLEVALVGGATVTKGIWSLIDIVDSANPAAGNYGDIDRSSYSWWQATETASGSMATQGLEDIRTAYHTTSRGGMDPVGFLITTQTVYEAYQARLQPHERLQSNKEGDLEFTHLLFANKPMFFSESMQSGVLLGINPKYVKLTINKNLHFKNQPFVRAAGGVSRSSVVEIMCQVTASRCASNFKLTGLTA
jgi:hypothetical protein